MIKNSSRDKGVSRRNLHDLRRSPQTHTVMAAADEVVNARAIQCISVGSAGVPAIGGTTWLDLQRERLASLVERVELAVDHGNLAGMLDPDFPVRRLGNAPEAAPVDDEPLIDARRPWPLDFLGPKSVRLDKPVDVFRAKSLGVIDVELAALSCPWVPPSKSPFRPARSRVGRGRHRCPRAA